MGPRQRLDTAVAVVLAVALVASVLLVSLAQRDDRRRFERRLVSAAVGDADFTEAAIVDLGRRQATAAAAVLAGPVDTTALGAVAAQLGVDFALLFGPDRDLLAVFPERDLDGAGLLARFPHLRRALAGDVGVSATLSAPQMASGVAIAVAAPFAGDDGRRVLSTAFDRTSTLLDSYLGTAGITPSTAAWLVDGEGGIVASGTDPRSPPATRPEPGAVEVIDLRGTEVAVATAAVEGTPWSVVLASPTSEIFASVQGMALWRPRLLLAFLLVAFVIHALLLRRNRAVGRKLAAANDELERSADRMREFVAVAAHELRTPTSVILGYASRLAGNWRDLDPDDVDHHMHRLSGSSRRLADLLGQLLDQATVDRGGLALELHDLDVLDLVATAVDDAGCGRLEHRVDVAPGTRVRADRTHLGRILVNLLENAVKYGRPPFEVVARVAGDRVMIVVRDHGPGVPDSFRPHLFERFARDTSGSHQHGTPGVGLGLSVARSLALEMGGSLEHEDAEPGARFVLVLPAAPAPVDAPSDTGADASMAR